jgi:hypothetical protein
VEDIGGGTKVKAEKRTDSIGGITYSDPTMVTVGFSRQTYGSIEGASLFGSSVKNHQVISLRITKADLTRNLSSDWINGDLKPIIEVLLTPLQFAEMLTTLNVGSGVPATLVQHNGERFNIPELPSHAEQFRDEIKDDLETVISRMREAEKAITDLIEDPRPVGKAVRKNLRDMVASYRNFIEEYIPFIISQFAKQMNRTVLEAKADVDAFVQETIVKTGIAELKKQAPQIENKTEDRTI